MRKGKERERGDALCSRQSPHYDYFISQVPEADHFKTAVADAGTIRAISLGARALSLPGGFAGWLHVRPTERREERGAIGGQTVR